MKGLIFEALTPQAEAASNRADLACFIGLAKVRLNEPPEDLRRWLQQEGWWSSADADGAQAINSLYDVPVPIASWERFDQLFAWNERSYGNSATAGATYLGAAVRSFFAQGGRKCYVVSLGEPIALDADRAARDALLLKLVPHDLGQGAHRREWHGLLHLFGLPGAAFVSMPDLPELACVYREATATPIVVPPPLPEFVECSEPSAAPEGPKQVVNLAPPNCTDAEYNLWRDAIHRACVWIAKYRRDMQLLASLPLPDKHAGPVPDLFAFMHEELWLSATPDITKSISTAFVQLAYPWARMSYAGDLPGNVEPPEGILAGLLARNALTRGTFRSATALSIKDVIDVVPRLSQAQQFALNVKAPSDASPQAPFIDRLSLIGPQPGGFQLLSDMTTANDINYRQANIGRTIALVMRAARVIGEENVFETTGERLWSLIRTRLEDVLSAMQRIGALAGTRPDEAFQVRCDRSTMTQNDIDNGRVIVQVLIRPAASIETMRIQLAIGDGGRVSLSALGMEAA